MKEILLLQLKRHVGLNAYRALRRGAILHVWRRSSPHNWWIENKRGEMLWHSDGWGDRPDTSIFMLRSDSKNKIEHSIVHSCGGLSESSEYVLKPEFLVRGVLK